MKITFDTKTKYGKFKPLNGTSGGPLCRRNSKSQIRSNFEDYKALKLPFSRTHDSALAAIYGGQFSYDISAIFPDFSKDENDEASYDFICTDEAIATTYEAGTKTFFRLGQSIEHDIKKHFVYPPKDFKKWAVICEHIIRHYTEGWANGFNYDMQFWEIWCEPDLQYDYMESPMWAGTKEQFFDLFEITAKHLKKCFPCLSIGGPGLTRDKEFIDEFLKKMHERNVPMDFFSWHIYANEPEKIAYRAKRFKDKLVSNGYDNTLSVLDEYNYIDNWTDRFKYSIMSIHGLKGASFALSVMSMAQKSSIDMMMYYDTRPSPFNGLFDFYSYEPLKTYYVFKWFSELRDECEEIREISEEKNIYSLAGITKNGKIQCALTYFDNDDSADDKEISLDFCRNSRYEIYILDENSNASLLKATSELSFTLKNHTSLFVKEI